MKEKKDKNEYDFREFLTDFRFYLFLLVLILIIIKKCSE
jgi:hypothetical protein